MAAAAGFNVEWLRTGHGPERLAPVLTARDLVNRQPLEEGIGKSHALRHELRQKVWGEIESAMLLELDEVQLDNERRQTLSRWAETMASLVVLSEEVSRDELPEASAGLSATAVRQAQKVLRSRP